MKIGILGPPGVGKSKFARELRKELDFDDATAPPIIDNYVQRLQKDTRLALGPWASYVENYMIAGERMRQEARRGADVITVGTIVDTVMYCSMRSDIVLHRTDSNVQEAYRTAQVAMQGITMWYDTTWDYNLAFFLPYDHHKHHAGWEAEYSRYMLDVLEAFRVPGVVTIERGTPQERAKLAAEVIRIAQREEEGSETPVGSSPAIESGVRPSDSDGEGQRGSAEPVPDVPSD